MVDSVFVCPGDPLFSSHNKNPCAPKGAGKRKLKNYSSEELSEEESEEEELSEEVLLETKSFSLKNILGL